jgi:hypothetical protein
MWPDFDRSIVNDLEFGRDLDPISIRIFDEDEEVVPGTMPSRTPEQLNIVAGKMI